MGVLVVYVGRAGQTNLGVGLTEGIWGFKERRAGYEDVAPGDTVLLGSGYTGGSVRVQPGKWAGHELKAIQVGRITSAVFEDTEPVWPDEKSGAASYPFRFRFEAIGAWANVSLAGEDISTELADAFRRSAIAQGQGVHLEDDASAALQSLPVVDEVEQAERAVSVAAGRGQGFSSNAKTRKVLEDHAMRRATEHYERQGWQVADTSKNESFDLRCTREGAEELRVEVKGTTTEGKAVLLTYNEVEHARDRHPHIALFVVSQIKLDAKGAAVPDSGSVAEFHPWEIEPESLKPIAYRHSVSG